MKADFEGDAYWIKNAWEGIAFKRAVTRERLESSAVIWTSNNPPEKHVDVWARDSMGLSYSAEVVKAQSDLASFKPHFLVVQNIRSDAHPTGMNLLISSLRHQVFHTQRELVLHLMEELVLM